MTGAALVALALAGCAGNSSPAATETVTPSPTASPTQTSVNPTPTPTPTSTAAAGDLCTTDHLTGAVGERDGAPAGAGDGMNQKKEAIIVTNTGSTTCTLQGWPGLSLVGKGNGTQLGAAAQLDRTTPHPTVTLAPGARAQAPFTYSNAQVYAPEECNLTDADGFRVYPPGSTTSLFISDLLQACTLTTHDLLTVGAFVPYP
ncbi:hypothetical protein GCM10022286_01000 [Gryllotalpicola daejeonensis]|uniref:DUF4232 domain-containing protein n=1 Tax=Gryllotalpicola daejeonensis TaxID=993087 RepID=A0ABP7ZD14_9MICO